MADDIANQKEFSERLARFRGEKGLTKAQLAKAAKISPSAITQYEKGEKAPSIVNVRRLAEVLGITVNDLCGTDTEDEWKEKPIVALLTALQLFQFQVAVTEDDTITLSLGEDCADYSTKEIKEFFKEYEMVQSFARTIGESTAGKEMVAQLKNYLQEKFSHLPGLGDYEPSK